jgi:hypothetical protein
MMFQMLFQRNYQVENFRWKCVQRPGKALNVVSTHPEYNHRQYLPGTVMHAAAATAAFQSSV